MLQLGNLPDPFCNFLREFREESGRCPVLPLKGSLSIPSQDVRNMTQQVPENRDNLPPLTLMRSHGNNPGGNLSSPGNRRRNQRAGRATEMMTAGIEFEENLRTPVPISSIQQHPFPVFHDRMPYKQLSTRPSCAGVT